MHHTYNLKVNFMNSNTENTETLSIIDFKRARNEEQKQLRITQFLDTAAKLYEEEGYEKLSLTQIGKELNFHRNNVYNYFNCKEDLFLALIIRELAEAVEDGLKSFNRHMSVVEFSNVNTQLIMRHQRLLDLLAITNTTILSCASANIHKRFRVQMKSLQDRLVQHLESCTLDNFPSELIVDLFRKINVYAMGIYPASVEYKQRHNIPVYTEFGYEPLKFEESIIAFTETQLNELNK